MVPGNQADASSAAKRYLTISFIEETTKDVAIPPREYDVPHTMCSHPFSQGRRLLSHEVRTARFAGRRAFLDMDNFRSFNHAHAEVVVDRNVLPRFMHCLEAHVYHHGYAYRQGGDEYVILLPAFLPSLTVPFLDDLRLKLSQLEYPEVQQSTTVSIGLCIAEPDCPLTDREHLQLASQAQKFAKDAGKDRIATYSRFPFSKETLSIVAPNEMIRSSQCT